MTSIPALDRLTIILEFTIMLQIRSSGLQAPIVFNCQLGAGRTTTGMVIGGLIQLYASATAAAAPLSLASSASLAHDLQLTKIQEELQGGSPKSGEGLVGWVLEQNWTVLNTEIDCVQHRFLQIVNHSDTHYSLPSTPTTVWAKAPQPALSPEPLSLLLQRMMSVMMALVLRIFGRCLLKR